MLDHKLITVKTSTDYFSIKDNIKVKEKTIYSGPIDHYFNYTHGHLDWRSVRFERVVSPHKDFQGTSVMNFADESPAYTRIHEPRHLHPERNYTEAQSLLFYEYSETNPEEPYYPVNNEENKVKLERYQELAKKEDKVLFGGRLGTYSYYDMDQVIGQALSLFETQIKS
jgi:UDP-galactopyranose mutase